MSWFTHLIIHLSLSLSPPLFPPPCPLPPVALSLLLLKYRLWLGRAVIQAQTWVDPREMARLRKSVCDLGLASLTNIVQYYITGIILKCVCLIFNHLWFNHLSVWCLWLDCLWEIGTYFCDFLCVNLNTPLKIRSSWTSFLVGKFSLPFSFLPEVLGQYWVCPLQIKGKLWLGVL